MNTKRTIKRNSTTIIVALAAIIIVAVVTINTIKTRGTDLTSVGLTSTQTISAYMNGVNEKDTMLLSDFGNGKMANNFADMVSRIYVLHKQRMMLSPLLKRMINPSYAELDYNVPYVRKLLAGGLLAVSGVAAAAVLTAKLFKD